MTMAIDELIAPVLESGQEGDGSNHGMTEAIDQLVAPVGLSG